MPVRKLVNPHRRRSVKRNASGRFMKARKAARKYHLRPRKKVNRRRRLTRTPAHVNRRRRNPSLVLMGLNPVRRSTMKRNRKKKNPGAHRRGHHYSLRARRPNPHVRHYRLRRRRNPFGLGNTEFLETSAFALLGGIATRAIPQAIAPTYNQGLVGYGLNAVTVAALSWLGGKWRKAAGLGIGIGGVVMLGGRIIQDYFGKQLVTFGLIDTSSGTSAGATAVTAPSSSTSSLSQGDLAFDLRGYKTTYFPLPSAGSKDLTTATPWSDDISKLQAQIAAASAKGKGGSGSAFRAAGPAPQATSSALSGPKRYHRYARMM